MAEQARKRNANGMRRQTKPRRKRNHGGSSRVIRRALLLAVIAVLAALAIKFLPDVLRKAGSGGAGGDENIPVNAVDATDVLHLSFPALYTPDGQEEGLDGGALTVKQFRRILEDLYARDYVLVNFYNLVSIGEEKVSRASLDVPSGKRPLVISQSGIRYGEGGDGYPVSLQFSGSGPVNAFKRADGTDTMGIYDVIPVVEEFLLIHPDFSYQGARGLIALSGEGGTFGFSDATDERFTALITELRSRGWHFASNGYTDISYGSDVELVEKDAEAWQEAIGKYLGTTDALFFPRGSDIGKWSGYTGDNRKYTYLSGLGFRYFLVEDEQNFTWMQIRDNYMRQVVHKIDTYTMYDQVIQLGEQ